MKKLIIIAFGAFLLGVAPLSACIIGISADGSQTGIGDVVTVNVDLCYEHRRCVISLEDTQLRTKGLEIVEREKWETIGSGHYRLPLKVRITAAKASLSVVRECSKKGISEETIIFKVK